MFVKSLLSELFDIAPAVTISLGSTLIFSVKVSNLEDGVMFESSGKVMTLFTAAKAKDSEGLRMCHFIFQNSHDCIDQGI